MSEPYVNNGIWNVNEVWKDIPGYEGLYQASNQGRIRRLANTCSGRWRSDSDRTLQFGLGSHGYYGVNLYDEQHRKTSFTVHSLVMLTFAGPSGGLQINHKNFDRTDNRLINLEYVTCSQNIRHAVDAGRVVLPIGAERATAKLTDDRIREIRLLLKAGLSSRKIGAQMGVSHTTILSIGKGKIWDHVED
jgi:hypothetical protein